MEDAIEIELTEKFEPEHFTFEDFIGMAGLMNAWIVWENGMQIYVRRTPVSRNPEIAQMIFKEKGEIQIANLSSADGSEYDMESIKRFIDTYKDAHWFSFELPDKELRKVLLSEYQGIGLGHIEHQNVVLPQPLKS